MHRAVEESWSSQILQYLRAKPEVLRAAASGQRQPRAPLAQTEDVEGAKESAPALLCEGAEREAS